ncbi:hypothetical protein B6U82_01655 [Candidatus Pacearchaeota archaeon ex4484_31]|nr:MAG: hypothetical protein B6U82_01655 [Candidatus Pacearchaeota archaeon ex4484_31]
MFRRKLKCPRCNRKIEKGFKFCPYCGACLETEKEPESLLDAIDEEFEMPSLFRFPFKRLFKQIDEQLKAFDKALSEGKMPRKYSSGISISISSVPGKEPVIKIKRFGPGTKKEEVIKAEQQKAKKISEEEAEKLAKLPRAEPETTVRRLTDKIVYEISLPGVKNKKDVMINRLENSIEIKAFSKDKAYFKLIPISLPIKRYYLKNEKLFLELLPTS